MLEIWQFHRQYRKGRLAAKQAYLAGAQLNPNRWVGKTVCFRDGFESTWANMEFVDRYERGETEYLAPMYGLCDTCAWPLEDRKSAVCRKCAAAVAARRGLVGRLRRITDLAQRFWG